MLLFKVSVWFALLVNVELLEFVCVYEDEELLGFAEVVFGVFVGLVTVVSVVLVEFGSVNVLEDC